MQLDGGEWKVGTIISDKSVRVIGFTEDINVSKQASKPGSAPVLARVRLRAWLVGGPS